MTITRLSLACCVIALLMSCADVSVQVKTEAGSGYLPGDKNIPNKNASYNNETLRVLTLNVAHGRKDGTNQLFLKKETIEENLTEVANVLINNDADIVALQEADGPSGWSGKFDHVASIAKQASYPWHFRANHASSWMFTYGTAILSRLPISKTIEHTFKPSPPTLNKGFLLSRVIWEPEGNQNNQQFVDVVSLHLDFSRRSVREKQIKEMADALSKRDNPMIILGDFNSDWFSESSVVKKLSEKAGFKVYQPKADNMYTYVSKQRRLDWILISNELEFVSYRVLPDIISDHFAVIAEVKLSE